MAGHDLQWGRSRNLSERQLDDEPENKYVPHGNIHLKCKSKTNLMLEL